MFIPFILAPMQDEQLKRIVKARLVQQIERDLVGCLQERTSVQIEILNRCFDGFFMLLKNEISGYTTNINEYIYFFGFLYEHYIEPLANLSGSDLEARL
jgi:hypothetical protein